MAESEARKQWSKVNVTYFSLKLQNSTDADIISKLKEQESIQGYIKTLIREDIKKAGK